ncbi:MAG: ABC transporter permease [Micromonosporaceae bacterium]|nr:ABC transporter permease [Micromonosporaceae bacterium]
MDVVASAAFALLDILSVLVLFLVTPSLGGFAPAEVLLVAGLAMVGFSTADLVTGNVERLRHYVRTGLLDAVLIRPLGVLPQLLAIDFAPRRLGRVAQSLLLLVIALSVVDVSWTPQRVLTAVLAPVVGTVFFGSLFVAGATVAFWWIESGEVANAFTYGGRDFTVYPVTIYAGWFRGLFAYGLGFAFVAYYPALVLLDRPDPLGAPEFVRWLGPVVAAVAAGLAWLAWRAGVRHYRSTGS